MTPLYFIDNVPLLQIGLMAVTKEFVHFVLHCLFYFLHTIEGRMVLCRQTNVLVLYQIHCITFKIHLCFVK